MRIKSYGNATIAINEVLFDPFVGLNPDCKTGHLKDYRQFETIFVTHGHFDHVKEVHKLLQINPRVKVFGPKKLIDYHSQRRWDKKRCFPLETGNIVHTQSLKITYYPSRHVVFDRDLVLNILKGLKKEDIKTIQQMIRLNQEYPMLDIGAYYIEGDIKVLLLGSCGLDERIEYPKDIDILLLAYQGNSQVAQLSAEIITKLKPKKVLCHHIDNSYPPLTQEMNCCELKKWVDIDVEPLT